MPVFHITTGLASADQKRTGGGKMLKVLPLAFTWIGRATTTSGVPLLGIHFLPAEFFFSLGARFRCGPAGSWRSSFVRL